MNPEKPGLRKLYSSPDFDLSVPCNREYCWKARWLGDGSWIVNYRRHALLHSDIQIEDKFPVLRRYIVTGRVNCCRALSNAKFV